MRHVLVAVCNQTERGGEQRRGWNAAYENKLKTAELRKGRALCTCKCGRREQADPGSEVNEIRDLSSREAACIKFGLLAPPSVVWSEESKSAAVTVMLQSRTQKDGWQWLRRRRGGGWILAAYWTTDGWGVEVNTAAPNHTTDLLRPQERSSYSKTLYNYPVWVALYRLRVWKTPHSEYWS